MSHVYTESAEYRKSASASTVGIHKAVCANQQCCHLANGNKTCPSLLVFRRIIWHVDLMGLYAKVHETVANV